MSRALARSRRRRARRNPSNAITEALPWVAGASAVGAALSVIPDIIGPKVAGASAIPYDALAGAAIGSSAVMLPGIVVALVSEKYRNAGLAGIGLGLGGWILFGMAASAASPVKTA
jgi:hypothetical protein